MRYDVGKKKKRNCTQALKILIREKKKKKKKKL
jgi:hypothetical protein